MIPKLLRAMVVSGVALALPAHAEALAWRAVDAATGQLTSLDDLTALARDFPDSATVRLRLLNAQAKAGDTDGAGRQALELAGRGYVFEPASANVLSAYLDLDYAQLFAKYQELGRRQVEASSLLSTIPAEAQLVESIVREPKSGDLYATTVVSRALYVKRGEAEWQRLDLPGAGSLTGIAYDPKKKLLWVASGDFDQTPGDKVPAALLGFDPVTGQVVRRLEAGGMAALGDVAAGDDGTVYVADPVQGIIHTAGPLDESLHALVGPGVFRSPQGMVAVQGGKLLIVSDYRYGLAAVDTASGRVRRLAGKPAMLDGIDGMARYGKSLIALQNGTSPRRIVKIDMADDWLSIRKLTVLESNHSGWSEPTGGTVDGDRLLYVANTQWERYGEGGAPVAGAEPGTTDIRTLPLGK